MEEGLRTYYPYPHCDPPRPLYRVAFGVRKNEQKTAGPADTAHWCLFLPHPPEADPTEEITPHQGMICHTGAWKENSFLTKTDRGLIWDEQDLGQTGAQSAILIPNCMVTAEQLRRAGEAVQAREGYKMLSNNCQHFVMNTMIELNSRHPVSVPWEAVDAVQNRGTMLTKAKNLLSWDRLSVSVRSRKAVF